MSSHQSTPLVSPPRLGGALVLAFLSAAFSLGTRVRTLGDAVVWVAVGTVVGYAVFTAMGLLADRIWQ